MHKLILKDPDFKKFFKHIKESYALERKQIVQSHPEFNKTLESFIRIVEEDLTKNLTNIDMYMRDLKRHALSEYTNLA